MNPGITQTARQQIAEQCRLWGEPFGIEICPICKETHLKCTCDQIIDLGEFTDESF
jgi:hypothetical protein